MIGIEATILSFLLGYYLLRSLEGKLFLREAGPGGTRTGFWEGLPRVIRHMVLVPAGYLVGTLLVSWATLLCAYLFAATGDPLRYANLIVLSLAAAATAAIVVARRAGARRNTWAAKVGDLISALVENKVEVVLLLIVGLLWGFMLYRSFHSLPGDRIEIGYTVWSDFAAHTAMIRSFSWGQNIPPQYPHYADGQMRYHFFFQFLSGNLEYLGLPMDWASNLPSLLSFLSFVSLLYAFAFIFTQKRVVGVLAVAMVFFRSSFAFFTYLMKNPPLSNGIIGVFSTTTSLGYTMAEDWGLWCVKPLMNQRHMPFAMGLMLVVLIAFSALQLTRREETERPGLGRRLARYFTDPAHWLPASWVRAIFFGIVMGLASYWNGAVVITTLLLMFGLAFVSGRRIEHVIFAVITVALTQLTTMLFVKPGSPIVQPSFIFGFIDMGGQTPLAMLKYYVEVFGIYPLLLLFTILAVKGKGRAFVLVCLLPVVFANTVGLTQDKMINYKYVAVAVYLLNVFVAWFLVDLFAMAKQSVSLIAHWLRGVPAAASAIILRVACVVCFVLLMITGVADLIILMRIDATAKYAYDLKSPLNLWIRDHTGKRDVFLTNIDVYSNILLSGRPIYNGWPYFSSSAGYDTEVRKGHARAIYAGGDPQQIRAYMAREGIRYVVVDDGVRNWKDIALNEQFFKTNMHLVYHYDPGNLDIYE
jgi:hypothetical protein